MQNKGFIKIISILLILVCLFYLSFSAVVRYYDNKAKQIAYEAIGESSEDYEGEWGDIPLVVSAQLNAKEQAELQREQLRMANGQTNPADGQQKTDPNAQKPQQGSSAPKIDDKTMGQLDNQITKAEENDEPTELVAVMKEVRRLLKSMR